MSASTTLLPFQPSRMSTAQLAAVSFLARYSGRTHTLYSFQLRQWFAWCESHGLDPLAGIQRAHVELYIRGLGERGLMDSSVVTMMHGVRGFFRFAHVDGLISADPAVYARLPKVQRDESRTQGLDRLELVRFLQVAQTISVHHGALAFLLGINALRRRKPPPSTSSTMPTRCAGTGSCTWSARATSRPPCRSRCRCCGCWRPAAASAPRGRWCCDRSRANRSPAATPTGWSFGSRRPPGSRGTSARTRCAMLRSPTRWMRVCRCATPRSWPGTPTPAPPALRPRPRQPGPPRRPLPHRLRRRRVNGGGDPRRFRPLWATRSERSGGRCARHRSGLPALHDSGCSRGLKPAVSSSDRAM